MPDSARPLPLACRQSDPDYPGEVVRLSDGWRIAVSMDADRYVIHQRCQGPLGEVLWLAPCRLPSSLAALVAKFGPLVPGLAEAAVGLPADPAAAVPGFASARLAQLQGLALARAQRAAQRPLRGPPARVPAKKAQGPS